MLSLLITMALTLSGITYVCAQADPGDPGDDPDKVPLDPGSWVLVAAGVGYGLKKWRDSKDSSVTFNQQKGNAEKIDKF